MQGDSSHAQAKQPGEAATAVEQQQTAVSPAPTDAEQPQPPTAVSTEAAPDKEVQQTEAATPAA